MDEVYTCICRGKTWVIHDGFIRCAHCQKEYKFKNFNALSGMKGQALQNVTDFNERVKKETEINPERMGHTEIGPRIGKPIK